MAASDYCEPVTVRRDKQAANSMSLNTHIHTQRTCTSTLCVCVCVCLRVRKYLHMHTDGTMEPATQGTTLIQTHTYGHLNHHTHPPILNPPTSIDTVYSELTNTNKGGCHKYEIVDEMRKGNTTSKEEKKEKSNKQSQ